MRSGLRAVAIASVSLGVLVGVGPAAAAPVVATSSPTQAAATSTTIGQTAPGTVVVCTGAPKITSYQVAVTTTPGYVVQTAGVLTSFSTKANATAGQVRAVVFGPSPTAGHRSVVAKSALQTVTPNALNTFPTRIPVQVGQALGLQTAADMACGGVGVSGDQMSAAAFDPDTSSDYTQSGPNDRTRVNVSAVLEPDADTDGYGDVSQDACPESAATQAACPAPDTTITKQPRKTTSQTRPKIKFTATVAGSSFTCSLDGSAYKPCTSPYRKRLDPGRHKVKIRALSPFGILDPTPAKVKFTVVQR